MTDTADLTFYTLTKLAPGVYRGLTPRHERQFIIFSYEEDGSAVTGDGRTIKGTRWAVLSRDWFHPDNADQLASGQMWYDALALDVETYGWHVAHADFRTRREARSWAETELDDLGPRDQA